MQQSSPKKEKSKFFWVSFFAILLFGLILFLRYYSLGSEFVWWISDGGKFLLPLVLAGALIDSINPCAFSILIVTVAFLMSIGRARGGILKIGLGYVFGIFMAYILIGLGLLQALHFFGVPHFMSKVGAVFLIAFGLVNIINEFFPSFPIKFRVPHSAHRRMAVLMERASLPTAFLLGGLVGICEFPCSGGPYIAILGLLHDTATYLKGFGYLVIYNLIFVLPLVVILFVVSNKVVLEKMKKWQQEKSRSMKLYGGAAMILLGALLFLI